MNYIKQVVTPQPKIWAPLSHLMWNVTDVGCWIDVTQYNMGYSNRILRCLQRLRGSEERRIGLLSLTGVWGGIHTPTYLVVGPIYYLILYGTRLRSFYTCLGQLLIVVVFWPKFMQPTGSEQIELPIHGHPVVSTILSSGFWSAWLHFESEQIMAFKLTEMASISMPLYEA